MLELYAMHWAIEVYFKESTQHLGFLQEQAHHYACYVAFIHLTAIRLLVIARQQHGASGVAQMRQSIVGNATQIDFAARLWGGDFRALLAGALESQSGLGCQDRRDHQASPSHAKSVTQPDGLTGKQPE